MKKELKNTEDGIEKIFKNAKDFLPLLGTDHIEFYVGNANKQLISIKLRSDFNHLPMLV